MTQESRRPRPRRPFWLAAGLAGVSLGIVALIASVPLLVLRDGGWPWMTTTSEQDSPPSATSTIVEDDGTVHRFTGAPTDMQTWVVSTEDRLRNEHGIPAKIAAGQAVRTAGWALLSVGLLVLIGRRLTLSARSGKTRRSDDGAGPPERGRRRGVRGTAGDQAGVR